ncbi:chaperone-like protein of POR1, chloroplastic [Tanacetum coccineum]
MASILLSNPVISSSFLGNNNKLSVNGNLRKVSHSALVFRSPRCAAADATYGGNIPKYPRSNVWDPYKRLGITTDASEEEVWSSRNFLLDQYGAHERSAESIEAAFEKILMTSFQNRKKTKINLKTRLKKKVEESPPWVQNLLNFVELPETIIILRRLFLFSFMAFWSVMNSAEGGPAFQVALSLFACIYFLNDKSKSVARASVIGFGSLVVGWICGSCLVPMIPAAILQPTWTLELLTSLVKQGLDKYNDPPRGEEDAPHIDQELDELLSSFQRISHMVNEAQTNDGKKRKIINKMKRLVVGNNTNSQVNVCPQLWTSQEGDDAVDDDEQTRLVGKQIGFSFDVCATSKVAERSA